MSDELTKIVAKDVFVDYQIKDTIKKAQKIAYQNAPDSLKKGAVNYSLTAAKVMPPPKNGNKGLKIEEKLYWRPIYNIINLLKKPQRIEKIFDSFRFGKHMKEKLRQAVKDGKYYVLVGYKDKGKHQFIQYGAKRAQLKQKWGRIKYRGLYKWLWGANFSDIGQKTPIAFRRLQNASPALEKERDLSSMELKKTNTSVFIQSQYYATGIDYFARLAERKALRSSLNKIKNHLNKKIKEEIKNV